MLEERAAQWKDEYIQQGMLIGEAKGRAEGEAKGRVEGIGLALRDLLEARFGSLPQDVISSITSSGKRRTCFFENTCVFIIIKLFRFRDPEEIDAFRIPCGIVAGIH